MDKKKQIFHEQEVEIVEIEQENDLIFEFKIDVVRIKIQTGDLFKIKTTSLLNIVDTNLILKYEKIFLNKYKQEL